MNYKKVVAGLLVLTLSGALMVGCKQKEPPIDDQDSAIQTDAQPTQTPEGSPEPSDAGGNPAATQKPNQPGQPTAKPSNSTSPSNPSGSQGSGGQTQPKPTVAPTQAPQPTQAPVVSISAQDLATKMVSALDPGTHNMSLMPGDLYSGVYGIDPSRFDSVAVYGSMMNVKSNEIIVIKAKDSAGVSAAKQVLQNRKAALKATWEHYLADQYELVKQSEIRAKGNYVVLVVAEQRDRAVNAFLNAV